METFGGLQEGVWLRQTIVTCLFFLDVGNFGSAFIELLVGAGEGGPYLTLLPSKMVMTPQESKKGLHRTGMLVITEGTCTKHSASSAWCQMVKALHLLWC